MPLKFVHHTVWGLFVFEVIRSHGVLEAAKWHVLKKMMRGFMNESNPVLSFSIYISSFCLFVCAFSGNLFLFTFELKRGYEIVHYGTCLFMKLSSSLPRTCILNYSSNTYAHHFFYNSRWSFIFPFNIYNSHVNNTDV